MRVHVFKIRKVQNMLKDYFFLVIRFDSRRQVLTLRLSLEIKEHCEGQNWAKNYGKLIRLPVPATQVYSAVSAYFNGDFMRSFYIKLLYRLKYKAIYYTKMSTDCPNGFVMLFNSKQIKGKTSTDCPTCFLIL